MKKTHLSTYNEGYAEYRIPGIICTGKNTLLAYCEGRCGGTDWGKIEIIVWRSEDPKGGERTWSEYSVLVPSSNDDTVNNANMIADGDTIHFIYHINYHKAYYMRSDDDGHTWTQPEEITYAFDAFRDKQIWGVCASGPSHGTKLSTGRLIQPIWIAYDENDPEHGHSPSKTGCIYSDDHGKTWKAGGLITDECILSGGETVCAELSNGDVMLNIRNCSGYRGVAVSHDGGETFDPAYQDTNLIDPMCSAGMTIYNGKIYLSNCEHEPGEEDVRCNLCLKASEDDGKTWTKVCQIEQRAGYSDIITDKDGKMYCFYECERPIENNSSFPQLHLTVAEIEI